MTYHIRSAVARTLSIASALTVAATAAFCINWLVHKLDSSLPNKSRLHTEKVDYVLPVHKNNEPSSLLRVVF